METKRPQSTRQDKLGLRTDEEAAIRAIAQRIGLRVSDEIASALNETIILIREVHGRSMTYTESIDGSDILTAPDVAIRLKISKTKAYQLIQQKQIRSISMGRTVRVRREDLEKFIYKQD